MVAVLEMTKDLSNIEETRFALNHVNADIAQLRLIKKQLELHLKRMRKPKKVKK